MIPDWLHALSIAALGLGGLCAALVANDVRRHPQAMWIMNVVWPVTALFGGPAILWLYFSYARLATRKTVRAATARGEKPPAKIQTPYAIMVAKGVCHCGAGCTLGDIVAEWLAFYVPAFAVALGWNAIFADRIFATWVLDFLLAFGFGIAFQYFTIKPMGDLSVGQGLVLAIKADTLSLTTWQVGMYGFMALAHFYIFGTLLGARLQVNSTEFWFMMQIAMLFGFVTAYPVNWWLIRTGVKEAM